MSTQPKRFMCRPLIAVACLLLLESGLLSARELVRWPDHCLARLDAANLLVDLNIELLRSRSATLVLEGWCREHAMAEQPMIVAHRVPSVGKVPTAEQLRRLRVRDAREVSYRSVELRCGRHVLSRADNWYVPARLSADMNRQLESTDTPFGKVIAPLQPVRRTIDMQTLWSPMPSGWNCSRFDAPQTALEWLHVPAELFRVRALVEISGGLPISEVNEVYQGELLNFREPGRSESAGNQAKSQTPR